MPFPSALAAGDYTALRSGGYAGESYVFFCPNETVFQAYISATPDSAVYAEITYTTVTAGSISDVKVGQTVLITTGTSDLRNPVFRGRVRKAPISGTVYINATSAEISAGYYITVLDTYEPQQRQRVNQFVDWDVTYANLLPAITNMQCFYYKEPTAGAASFSFAPVGIAMADGASISSYAWVIPDATYTVGNASTQNITVSVTEGYRWAQLTVTDSNSQALTLNFEILVCDRSDDSLFYLDHRDISITGDWTSGYTANVTYLAGISALMDRTRCAIVSFDSYKSGSTTFNNVSFVGYARTEQSQTSGDEIAAQLQETGFEIVGMAALAGELPCPSLGIRNVAAPDAWDEIDKPNPARVISYLFTRYSTLANVCPLDYGTVDDTYFRNDIDLVENQSLLDTANKVGSEINAQLLFAPQGDGILRRNACYQTTTERNNLTTVANFAMTDFISFRLDRAYRETTGQVIVGNATFNTTTGGAIKLTATAPAVAKGEGQDIDILPNQLLESDLSDANARIQAATRAANHLAYVNPVDRLTVRFIDACRFLIPSMHQWYTFTIPSTEDARGIAYTTSIRWLLESVSHTYNVETNTREIEGTFRRESIGGAAKINVELSPSLIDDPLPILPFIPEYGVAPAPSINYTSVDPDDLDLQPYNPSGGLPLDPLPTDQAQDKADNAGEPNCRVQNPPIYFANSANVASPFVTVNTSPYSITLRGMAQIAAATWTQSFDFTASNNWSIVKGTDGVDRAVYTGGSGYTRLYNHLGTGMSETRIYKDFTSIVTSISIVYTANTAGSEYYIYYDKTAESGSSAGACALTLTSGTLATGTNQTLTITSTFNTAERLRVDIQKAMANATLTIHSITLTGQGTNPFGGTTDNTITYGDAFYYWQDDVAAQLYSSTEGLRIDNSAVSVPPEYNPNHEYTLAFTGTGNQINFRMQYADYSQVSNQILYALICGSGAGQ